MTNQTKSLFSLGGSLAGLSIPRLCTLTLVATLAVSSSVSGIAQQQPSGENAKQQPAAIQPAKKATETKTTTAPEGKMVGAYQVHQMIELGGRHHQSEWQRCYVGDDGQPDKRLSSPCAVARYALHKQGEDAILRCLDFQ